MIELGRSLAQALRNVIRRVMTTNRGTWPNIVIRAGPAGLEIQCDCGETRVIYHDDSPRPKGKCSFTGEHLAAFAGGGDAIVQLEESGENLVVTWQDQSGPHVVTFPKSQPDKPRPVVEVELTAASPQLLSALFNASVSAGKDPTRYALNRIQLRGRRGEIVGTDSKVLLIQGGFELPFADDVLIPALPVFGCREFQSAGDARIALARDHLVLAVGPWRLEFTLDREGRYPDCDAVIPTGKPSSEFTIDDLDVDFLATRIQEWPAEPDGSPGSITVDLNNRLIVRAAKGRSTIELALNRSPIQGRPMRLVFDRKQVLRALALGFRRFQCFDPTRPILAHATGRRFVVMPLDPHTALPPTENPLRLESSGSLTPIPNSRSLNMPRNTLNGHNEEPIDNGALAQCDPLTEAESLRGVLQDAQVRVGRLINSLKSVRKQRKALESAMTSLRQLEMS